MEDNQLMFKIALSLLPKIGNVMGRSLVACAGLPEKVFVMSKTHLMKVPRIGEQVAMNILEHRDQALRRAELEMKFIEQYKIKAYFYLDPNYPHRLKNCDDAPVMLYTKGLDCLEEPKALAVVGTRNATPEGRENTENLVAGLAQSGHAPTIVSGLAYGIDIYAHKAALKNQLKTIAVLATGLDSIYPAAHTPVAREIVESGALVTEFMSQTPLSPKYFLLRNRIIAGLSDATLVLESGEKGGALGTAAYSNQYGREVFAFPGRITDKYSEGCNRLIRSGKALIYQDLADLLQTLKWTDVLRSGVRKTASIPQLFDSFSENENMILDLLRQEGGLQIDAILHKTNLPMSKVSSSLLNLEFAGVVKVKPGKVYCCC